MILPVSAVTDSLKVITRFASNNTPVALSAGDKEEMVGAPATEILKVDKPPDEAEGVYSITYGRVELEGKSFQVPDEVT